MGVLAGARREEGSEIAYGWLDFDVRDTVCGGRAVEARFDPGDGGTRAGRVRVLRIFLWRRWRRRVKPHRGGRGRRSRKTSVRCLLWNSLRGSARAWPHVGHTVSMHGLRKRQGHDDLTRPSRPTPPIGLRARYRGTGRELANEKEKLVTMHNTRGIVWGWKRKHQRTFSLLLKSSVVP
jgi:hypothetical protein